MGSLFQRHRRSRKTLYSCAEKESYYPGMGQRTDRELVSPSQLSPQLGVAPTALQNVIQRVLAESREMYAIQREIEVYQKKSEWILGGCNSRYLPSETTVSLMKLRDTNNNFKKFRSWILFALQSSGSSPRCF